MLPHWFNVISNLFYHDELRVLVGPQYIELWRLRGLRGFKPKLAHQQTVNVTEERAATSPDDWQGVVKRLQALLKEDKWQAVSATVILSSHFMRYAVIPWNSEITTAGERQAYLNHHFVMTYGDAVKAWNMRMDEASYKKSALASAMPAGLQTALKETFANTKANNPTRLAAIYPYLMLAANQALGVNRLIHNCWFAVVESQRLTLSLIENGEWQVVRSLPLESDVAAQIEALILREMMLENVSIKQAESRKSHPVLMHWSKVDEVKTIEINHRRVVNVVSSQHPESRRSGAQQIMHWATR